MRSPDNPSLDGGRAADRAVGCGGPVPSGPVGQPASADPASAAAGQSSTRPSLSVIVPCFNEEEVLPLFHAEAARVLSTMDCGWELLFVDDGSTDGTATVLRALAESDPHVSYLRFSRNFGKEAALYAGLCHAVGATDSSGAGPAPSAPSVDYVAVMDADLQHPPALLPQMLAKLQAGGCDVVAARRTRAGDPPLRAWLSRWFYRVINRISSVEMVDGGGDFRMMRCEVARAIVAVGERNRFSKGIYGWVGFRTEWLPYDNAARAAGSTKWSMGALFRYALDGITDFSQVPLSIASWMGVLITLASFAALVFVVVRKLLFGDPVAGWASTICVILFMGGVQLLFLGVIGQYLAKLYVEVKHRPHYIVAEEHRAQVPSAKGDARVPGGLGSPGQSGPAPDGSR